MEEKRTIHIIFYILFSMLLWFLVTFAVGFEFNLAAWLASVNTLALISILYAALFALLFFILLWAAEKVFITMLIVMLALEIFIFGNDRFTSYPEFLYAIPISILLYSVFTFLPLWMIEHSLKKHTHSLIGMTLAFILVILFNYIAFPIV